jgi:DNA-3-methyladenine glycosylase II
MSVAIHQDEASASLIYNNDACKEVSMDNEFGPPPFDLRLAMQHLAAKDQNLAKIMDGTLEYRIRIDDAGSPYEVLLRSVVYQSISGKAAATIFARIKSMGMDGRVPAPQEMLRLRKSALRKAGLSGAKIAAMKDLARKTLAGVVPSFEEAEKLADEELVQRLTQIRGIGAWTVEMFLIFRLGRPDVLPIHDLGIKKGWAVTYDKKHMPSPKELLAFGERWRPYRTVASWYMWRACERAGSAITRKIVSVRKQARKKRTSAPIEVSSKANRAAPRRRT